MLDVLLLATVEPRRLPRMVRDQSAEDEGPDDRRSALDDEHPSPVGRRDQVARDRREPHDRHRVAQDEERVGAAALGAAEPVRQEDQHRRDDRGLGDPQGEPVDHQQPQPRDHTLGAGEHPPQQHRPEDQLADALALGVVGRRDLEDEVADEEEGTEKGGPAGRQSQIVLQPAGDADRVVRPVEVGKAVGDEDERNQPAPTLAGQGRRCSARRHTHRDPQDQAGSRHGAFPAPSAYPVDMCYTPNVAYRNQNPEALDRGARSIRAAETTIDHEALAAELHTAGAVTARRGRDRRLRRSPSGAGPAPGCRGARGVGQFPRRRPRGRGPDAAAALGADPGRRAGRRPGGRLSGRRRHHRRNGAARPAGRRARAGPGPRAAAAPAGCRPSAGRAPLGRRDRWRPAVAPRRAGDHAPRRPCAGVGIRSHRADSRALAGPMGARVRGVARSAGERAGFPVVAEEDLRRNCVRPTSSS